MTWEIAIGAPVAWITTLGLAVVAYWARRRLRLDRIRYSTGLNTKSNEINPLKDEVARLEALVRTLTQAAYPSALRSSEPILEIKTKKIGWERKDPIVHAMSPTIKQFFGMRPDLAADEVLNQPADDLVMKLQDYIAPPESYWDDLLKDQARAMAVFLRGQEPTAGYPVLFRSNHPFYGRRTFVPIVTETREIQEADGTISELMKVLYLDTQKLPSFVLRRELWESLRDALDANQLAFELESVFNVLSQEPRAHGVDEQIRSLGNAIDALRKGDGLGVIECCASVGLFRLREYARDLKLSYLADFVTRIVPPPHAANAARPA